MSDIKKINGKYYDFDPKNKSFLVTANELRVLGIKNYYFMLRIDNPRVADIDPFKKDITKQEVAALMREFMGNVWSFMRMAVRVRTDAGVVPYTLHRGLCAVTWCFERHQDNCICEPRQTYKTTGTIAGPIQWAFQLSENLHMHFFGKETDNTKRNLAHLKSDIELLPEWLQFRRYIDDQGKMKKTRAATEILENKLRNNDLAIHPKPTSLSHAQGLGRGGSGAILYFDEIEHTPFFGEIMSNSAPLFKTASENAALANKPYCRLMSCTPGNLDTREGRESLPIIKSMIPWTEKIYDMTEEELKEYKAVYKEEYHNSEEKKEREVIDVFYIEYQYYQVRKTYDWVMEQYKLSGDKMAIRREILLQRLRGSNASPISPEDIEYFISNMKRPVNDFLICNKWKFILYEHGASYEGGIPKDLDENIPYLVGIDPAGGGGGDNFAITIVNPYNLQIAAEFKSPYISGPAAVKMLIELVVDHIPKAVLIPEKNSMGIYLIQMLLETEIRDNIYWSEKENQLEKMTEDSEEDNELKALAAEYKKYGTYLTKKVRDAMLELLFQHIAECKQLLTTEYLVNDMCKLIRTSTGRIEADKGEHDDCLFSYLHAIYIYHTGDNLETFGVSKVFNPLLKNIDLDNYKDQTANESAKFIQGIFNPQQRSYDDIVMEDAARVEAQTKELVERFSFIHDGVYSKNRNKNNSNPYDDTTSIGVGFFDTINGIFD